tara:strand:+ start:24196 stop:24576 length:381 start_codon:yes stop_codon:yes gene_type:complete
MKGFTVIEMVVALVIAAVLAALAYPSYQEYVQRGNRADGYGLIVQVVNAQERFFAEELTYTEDLTDLGYASDENVSSDDGNYLVSAAACGGGTIADCVVVTGVAQGTQAEDGNLSLDTRGVTTGNW